MSGKCLSSADEKRSWDTLLVENTKFSDLGGKQVGKLRVLCCCCRCSGKIWLYGFSNSNMFQAIVKPISAFPAHKSHYRVHIMLIK